MIVVDAALLVGWSGSNREGSKTINPDLSMLDDLSSKSFNHSSHDLVGFRGFDP